MDEFITQILEISNPKTLFLLCGIFIFADVITGYLKAIKLKKINSSISRDGYIKKISWIIAIILGFLIDCLVNVNIFLIGSALVCIATESVSTYENLGKLGITLPFIDYFEKINKYKK